MHIFPSSADPNNCIFVRNLSFHCTNQILRALFRKFGVQSANVQRGQRDQSMYYGTVVLHQQANVNRAIQSLNGSLQQGRYIVIERYSAESVHASQDDRPFTRCQLQVSFKQKEPTPKALVITEQEIRTKLEPFGNVIDVIIKKHCKDSKQMLGGFAFVQFEHFGSVHDAIAELNDQKIGCVHWNMSISNKFRNESLAYAEEDFIDEKEGSYNDEVPLYAEPRPHMMFPVSMQYVQPQSSQSPYNGGFPVAMPHYGMLPPSPESLYHHQGHYFGQPFVSPPPLMHNSPILRRVVDGAFQLPTLPMPSQGYFYQHPPQMGPVYAQNGHEYYLSRDSGDESVGGAAPDAGYGTQGYDQR